MDWGRKDRIEREAAEWVVLIDSSAFDAGAAARVQHWLGKSEDHRAAFRRANRAWSDLDQLAKLRAYPEIVALLAMPANDTAPGVREGASPDRRTLILGAGTSVVALGVAGFVLSRSGPAQAIETGIGEQREVTLQDGTIVFLNAKTRIEPLIDEEMRRVRLTAGEALFSIAEREGQAFSIVTEAGGVEAGQGEVLVKIIPGGARISLLTGEGRLWRAGLFGARAAVETGSRSELELSAGELRVTHIEEPVAMRRTLWREGRLGFDNTPLAEAVDDVSRQTGVAFIFADPALGALRVGGVVDARDLNGFLLLLRQSLGIDAQPSPDGVIALSQR